MFYSIFMYKCNYDEMLLYNFKHDIFCIVHYTKSIVFGFIIGIKYYHLIQYGCFVLFSSDNLKRKKFYIPSIFDDHNKKIKELFVL